MDSAASSRRSSAASSGSASAASSTAPAAPYYNISELDTCGLEEEQVCTLKRTFDQFDADKTGAIPIETVNTILKMMGMHVSSRALEVGQLNV